jgi:hypothetical protein
VHNTANRGPTDRDPAPYQRGGGRGEGRDRDEYERKKPCSKPPKKPCHEEEEEVAQYEWKCVKVCEPKKHHDKEHKEHKDDDKNKKCSTKKWNHAWDD